MKGHVIELPGEKTFPNLYTLMGGYFHQDFDINGHTLEEVLASFMREEAPEMWRGAREDIERFLAERPDDKRLGEDVQRMFRPDVMAEGWEPDITNWRQWLTRVSELLNAGVPAHVERQCSA